MGTIKIIKIMGMEIIGDQPFTIVADLYNYIHNDTSWKPAPFFVITRDHMNLETDCLTDDNNEIVFRMKYETATYSIYCSDMLSNPEGHHEGPMYGNVYLYD